MNSMIVLYFGYFAGFCTTIAFLPQVIKVWKNKSTKDISLSMFIIFLVGVISWLIYGILSMDMPMIIANSITFILGLFILIGKIKFG